MMPLRPPVSLAAIPVTLFWIADKIGWILDQFRD